MAKLIFLDRDGVINVEPGERLYVMRWKDFRFLPGAKTAIRKLTKAGYKIFIISNQAGVGKGLFTQKALDGITKNMIAEVRKFGGDIEGVYYCIHKSEDNCNCRKPKIGLLEKALRELFPESPAIAKDSVYFIGDDKRDIEAGYKIGRRTALVLSGKTKRNDLAGFNLFYFGTKMIKYICGFFCAFFNLRN